MSIVLRTPHLPMTNDVNRSLNTILSRLHCDCLPALFLFLNLYCKQIFSYVSCSLTILTFNIVLIKFTSHGTSRPTVATHTFTSNMQFSNYVSSSYQNDFCKYSYGGLPDIFAEFFQELVAKDISWLSLLATSRAIVCLRF